MKYYNLWNDKNNGGRVWSLFSLIISLLMQKIGMIKLIIMNSEKQLVKNL